MLDVCLKSFPPFASRSKRLTTSGEIRRDARQMQDAAKATPHTIGPLDGPAQETLIHQMF